MKKSTTLLSKEDRQILEFLAKFGVAHDRHILPYIDSTHEIKNYSKIIKRLVSANYLVEHKLYKDDGAYLTLGECGADLAATKAVKSLSLNTLKHDMLLIDLYFDLLEKNPGCEISSERELRFGMGIKVGDKKKVPDLLMKLSDDRQIAIEVEISEKSQARLIEIINNYLNDTKLYAAHYFVKSKALGNKLLKLSGYHSKIKVFLLGGDEELMYSELQVEAEDRVEKAKSPWSFDLDEYLNNREKYKKIQID